MTRRGRPKKWAQHGGGSWQKLVAVRERVNCSVIAAVTKGRIRKGLARQLATASETSEKCEDSFRGCWTKKLSGCKSSREDAVRPSRHEKWLEGHSGRTSHRPGERRDNQQLRSRRYRCAGTDLRTMAVDLKRLAPLGDGRPYGGTSESS